MSQEHLSGASSQADSVQHRIDAVGSNDENEGGANRANRGHSRLFPASAGELMASVL